MQSQWNWAGWAFALLLIFGEVTDGEKDNPLSGYEVPLGLCQELLVEVVPRGIEDAGSSQNTATLCGEVSYPRIAARRGRFRPPDLVGPRPSKNLGFSECKDPAAVPLRTERRAEFGCYDTAPPQGRVGWAYS